MKLAWQFLLLASSFGFVFVWQQTPLSDYTIPMLGFLIFLFLILSARKHELNPMNALGNNELMGIFILNSVIMLLIFSTGIFSSPLFFLLYFLEFGIAFVLEPTTVFFFFIGVVLVFLPDALKDDPMGNFIRLGSLGLISPLAFYFGKEYVQKADPEPKGKK